MLRMMENVSTYTWELTEAEALTTDEICKINEINNSEDLVEIAILSNALNMLKNTAKYYASLATTEEKTTTDQTLYERPTFERVVALEEKVPPVPPTQTSPWMA